jgi:BMFP domain-containing protein YqiC
MLDKETLERLVNKVSDCIPESFKQCKDDFKTQAQSVIEKILSECQIVTQSDIQHHLQLLEHLQARVVELEQRLKDFEAKNKK